MTPDEDRIERLHAALNARDLDATVACFAPTARFADPLEGGEVHGLDGVRAHFTRLFDAVRLEISTLDYQVEPDGRLRARLQVVVRGRSGGLWQDGRITVWYRLDGGLIVEQEVDDSGRDGAMG